MKVGVIVATFGSDEWRTLGEERASEIASFWSNADLVSHVHGESLAAARNTGINQSEADYIIICDADDSLDERYEEVLMQNIKVGDFLYQPSTLGVYSDGTEDDEAHLIPDRDMNVTNSLVIGTVFPRGVNARFDPSLDALEDWDFFAKVIMEGYKVIPCPDMIYRVGIRENSRNKDARLHNRAYQEIRRRPYIGRLHNYMEESE